MKVECVCCGTEIRESTDEREARIKADHDPVCQQCEDQVVSLLERAASHSEDDGDDGLGGGWNPAVLSDDY